MWQVGVPWLVLSLGVAVACGGRSERSVGRYQPSAPTAGAVDHAGSPASPSGGQSGAEGGVGVGGDGGEVAIAGSAGATDACASQFVDYGDYRSQVVAEFASFGCKVDSDCLAFYDQSACDPSCVLVITGARRGVIDRLNNFETSSCVQDCWPMPRLGCPAAEPARCVAGGCQ